MGTIYAISDILACVISFSINIWILSSFLIVKRKIYWFDYFFFGAAFVIDTHYEIFSNTISSLLGMIICLLFSIIFYQGKIIKKILIILNVNVFTIIIGIISMDVFSLIGGSEINTLMASDNMIRLFELVFMKMLCILVAYMATRFINKGNYLSKEIFLIIAIFFICFFSVVLFFFITYISIPITLPLQIMFLAVNGLMFILNVLILFLVKRFSIQNKFQMENMVLKTQLQEQAHAIKSVEEYYLQIRSIRHDMNGYLTSYLLLLEEGKVDSVKKDIRKMLQQRIHTDVCFYTSNQLLNAILNEQCRICGENSITCHIQVDLREQTDLIEFSVILLNLFINAIEAEQREPENCRAIALYLSETSSSLHLLLKNSIQNSILKNNPRLSTTKKCSRDHGLGLHSVLKLVEQNHGCMEIFEEEHCFAVQIMYPLEFGNNHL